MTKLRPELPCPCGSERLGAACCVVENAPAAGIAVGFDRMRLSMRGVYIPQGASPALGILAGLPEDVRLSTTVRNPYQLDADIEGVSDLLSSLLHTKEQTVNQNTADGITTNLHDGLSATRYHQRQYIYRHRVLCEHGDKAKVSGSSQIEVIWHDVPLKAELEAVLLRSRFVLDTIGRVGMLSLGKKDGSKFGNLWTFVKTTGAQRSAVGAELNRIFTAHEKWLAAGKDLRDTIAHGGNATEFRGPKVSVLGIDPARMQRDDASEYVISMWRQLIAFVSAILLAVTSKEMES